jgi:hypothetical protein
LLGLDTDLMLNILLLPEVVEVDTLLEVEAALGVI